jgi:hypothetical protein
MSGAIAATACLAALLTVSALPVEAVIDIVDDPRVVASDRIDVGRRFGTAPCETTRPGRTIVEAVPDAQRISSISSTESGRASMW